VLIFFLGSAHEKSLEKACFRLAKDQENIEYATARHYIGGPSESVPSTAAGK
jgi:hypothetical protein